MEMWVEVIAITLPILLLLAAVIAFFLRRRRPEFTGATTLQEGISKLRDAYSPSCIRPSHRFHSLDHGLPGDGCRRQHQQQPVFYWEDHPALVAEAAEGGWSKFAFASASWPPQKQERRGEAEVEWEKPRGSSEFMQAVRLDCVRNKPTAGHKSVHRAERSELNSTKAQHRENSSGLTESHRNRVQPEDGSTWTDSALADERASPNPFSSIMMDLPLPGPAAANTSFPQEGYFEVTILYIEERRQRARSRRRAMDRLKLIFPRSRSEDASELAIDTGGGGGGNGEEEVEGLVALGLSRGGCDENNGVPGTYSGSIGFFSDGAILLDGAKLISESSKYQWGTTNKVIGCGFNPRRKKVIFTLDSELLHAVNCSSATFTRPLFPTLATSIDIMVLVNLGQKPFAYKPANAWRSPAPCFPLGDAHSIGEENFEHDVISRELFSMGRLDPRWHEEGETNGNDIGRIDVGEGSRRVATGTFQCDSDSVIVDMDAVSDFFEIDIKS